MIVILLMMVMIIHTMKIMRIDWDEMCLCISEFFLRRIVKMVVRRVMIFPVYWFQEKLVDLIARYLSVVMLTIRKVSKVIKMFLKGFQA